MSKPFSRRTYNIYRHQKNRLGDLPYTIDELRDLVKQALDVGYCIFCTDRLTEKNFSIDHNHAISKGGSIDLWNLVVCCDPCNRAKGPLNGTDFKNFTEWMRSNLPREDWKWIIGRIKASGGLHFKRKKQ